MVFEVSLTGPPRGGPFFYAAQALLPEDVLRASYPSALTSAGRARSCPASRFLGVDFRIADTGVERLRPTLCPHWAAFIHFPWQVVFGRTHGAQIRESTIQNTRSPVLRPGTPSWCLKPNDEDLVSRMCRRLPLLIQDFHQQGVGIDRRSLPPMPLRTKAKDSQMQVRRISRGVAGRAHTTEDVAFMNGHSFTGS